MPTYTSVAGVMKNPDVGTEIRIYREDVPKNHVGRDLSGYSRELPQENSPKKVFDNCPTERITG
jgi:hypothetical protein